MAEQPVDLDRQALLERLTGAGIRFVVVGGAAIQTYGISYRTEDVDLTPDVSEENLQRLSDVLNEFGCSLEIDPARPETAVKLPPGYVTPKFLRDAHALNLRTPFGHLDLTLHPSGFPAGYEDLAPRAEIRTLAATTIAVPIARLADVEHSKRTANREKDRLYLRAVGRLQAPDAPPTPDSTLAQAIDADAPPATAAYLVDALGSRPDSHRARRLWEHGAERIAEFRERWGITDEDSALGAVPTAPEQVNDRVALERTLQRTRMMIDRALEPPQSSLDLGR